MVAIGAKSTGGSAWTAVTAPDRPGRWTTSGPADPACGRRPGRSYELEEIAGLGDGRRDRRIGRRGRLRFEVLEAHLFDGQFVHDGSSLGRVGSNDRDDVLERSPVGGGRVAHGIGVGDRDIDLIEPTMQPFQLCLGAGGGRLCRQQRLFIASLAP